MRSTPLIKSIQDHERSSKPRAKEQTSALVKPTIQEISPSDTKLIFSSSPSIAPIKVTEKKASTSMKQTSEDMSALCRTLKFHKPLENLQNSSTPVTKKIFSTPLYSTTQETISSSTEPDPYSTTFSRVVQGLQNFSNWIWKGQAFKLEMSTPKKTSPPDTKLNCSSKPSNILTQNHQNSSKPVTEILEKKLQSTSNPDTERKSFKSDAPTPQETRSLQAELKNFLTPSIKLIPNFQSSSKPITEKSALTQVKEKSAAAPLKQKSVLTPVKEIRASTAIKPTTREILPSHKQSIFSLSSFPNSDKILQKSSNLIKARKSLKLDKPKPEKIFPKNVTTELKQYSTKYFEPIQKLQSSSKRIKKKKASPR